VFRLRQEGFVTHGAANGLDGLSRAELSHPTVIILDIMLPDIPGTEVCRRLRSDPALAGAGILMLTAKGEEIDRVLGLEMGADDYVVKPFSVRELIARVKALARRVSSRPGTLPLAAGHPLAWKGITVDQVAHRVLVDDEELDATPMEFKLLELLLSNPGRAFSRVQILGSVWNVTSDVTTRTVDTHVKRLRVKLGTYGEIIETVRGVGYRLREP